jgi:hypothetical protein
MTPTLIVLILAALGVAVVVWFTRRKPDATRTGPRDGDTAWNDPVTPGAPAAPTTRPDTVAADTPPARDLPLDPRP